MKKKIGIAILVILFWSGIILWIKYLLSSEGLAFSLPNIFYFMSQSAVAFLLYFLISAGVVILVGCVAALADGIVQFFKKYNEEQ